MRILWRVLRILAAIVLGLYGVGIAALGGSFLWPWVQMLFTDAFYIVWDYLVDGLFLLVLGLLVLLPAVYVLLRRQARVAWLLVSLVILLLAAMLIPSMRLDPVRAAQYEVSSQARNVHRAVVGWAAEKGRLPANEAELLSVAQAHGSGSDDPLLSRYARGGERLPYQLVYIANATGPHLPQPPAAQPGVIYCAVSADLKRLWLTATGLERTVNGPIVFVKDYSGKRLATEFTFEATPPTD